MICTLISVLQAFSPANAIFAGVGVLLSVRIFLDSFKFSVKHRNASSQVAKDSRASQDALIDIFERMEMFFRRLETYTEVPSTEEMMDMIILIMVEVLSIFGTATKEIRQGQMSKYLRYKYDGLD